MPFAASLGTIDTKSKFVRSVDWTTTTANTITAVAFTSLDSKLSGNTITLLAATRSNGADRLDLWWFYCSKIQAGKLQVN